MAANRDMGFVEIHPDGSAVETSAELLGLPASPSRWNSARALRGALRHARRGEDQEAWASLDEVYKLAEQDRAIARAALAAIVESRSTEQRDALVRVVALLDGHKLTEAVALLASDIDLTQQDRNFLSHMARVHPYRMSERVSRPSANSRFRSRRTPSSQLRRIRETPEG